MYMKRFMVLALGIWLAQTVWLHLINGYTS